MMADGYSREVGGLVSSRCTFRVTYCVTASFVQPECSANARLRPSRDQGACLVTEARTVSFENVQAGNRGCQLCQSQTSIRAPSI
jgi:hypothetical protein